MKKIFITVMMLALFIGCTQTSFDDEPTKKPSNNSGSTNDSNSDNTGGNTPTEPGTTTTVYSEPFFWGNWINMANGQCFIINETTIKNEESGDTSTFSTATESVLSIKDGRKFTKESDSVIKCNDIPYFRQGGSNLSYTVKLVGFTGSRAGNNSQTALSNRKIKNKSSIYKTFEKEAQTDTDGVATLTAPTVNDIQTLIIEKDGGNLIVPGIKIENNGAFMGTIAVVDENQYSLKITGTIDDSEKEGGYLYGDNYKTYPMTLTITNISNIKSGTSVCTIKSTDDYLKIVSTDGTNLDGCAISTLNPGFEKTIKLNVTCDKIDSGYVDTGITVKVSNPSTGQEWEDFIPLRFFKGQSLFTINAHSTENNAQASLNGFLIYPDGNNQFFCIPHGNHATIRVPSFGEDQPFTMVFSGATVSGTLSNSTEMFYTVTTGSTPKEIITSGSDIASFIMYGESNNTENDAVEAENSFEAYLSEGDIDFFKVKHAEIVEVKASTIRTIRLDACGGTSFNAVVRTNYGEAMPSITPPIKSGYYFTGYYTSSTGGTKYYNANGTSAKNCDFSNTTTLYAQWLDSTDFVHVKGATITGAMTAGGYTDDSIFKDGVTVIVNDFYISNHEVTQAEYEKYCSYVGDNKPSSTDGGVGNNYPAYYVSWFDALVYCNKRSIAEGLTPCYTISGSTNPTDWGSIPDSEDHENLDSWNNVICNFGVNGYRLPTEAEWEYAARGGNELTGYQYEYAGSDTIGDVAWYANNSGRKTTHEVKGQKANGLGLYDMSGNVYEWCWGSVGSGYRYRRGGSWCSWEDYCTVSSRDYYNARYRNYNNGFRVVRTDVEVTGTIYTITYKLNGGTNATNNPVSYNIETDTITLTNATRTGYAFDGWYDEAGNEVTQITKGSTGDMTLYAKWREAAIGDIAYSDSKTSADYDSTKTPVGIVIEITEGVPTKIVSLTQTSAKWSTECVTTKATSETDGNANLTAIQGINSWETKYPAFKWCDDYTDASGNSNWYLPAKDELRQLYKVKDAVNAAVEKITTSGGTATKLDTDSYWSSSQSDSDRVWFLDFSDGYGGNWYYKGNTPFVRAVRAF